MAVTGRLSCAAALFLQISLATASPPAAGHDKITMAARYIGSAGCSSSSCHGAAGERHNQYLVWSQHDFHARASLILTNARSMQMAQSLGLASASSDARCTVCHSPLSAISPGRIAHAEQRDNGVSCESCHGPAESWLRSHTRRDYTYAMRVSSGLRDLRNLYVRANACVACHQVLEPEVATAGHPSLFFELATQLASEPPHWRDTGDSSMQTWLTGQAVALRELSWSATRDRTTGAAEQAVALSWLLAMVTRANPSLPSITERADPAQTQKSADELARRAAVRRFASEDTSKLVRLLSSAVMDMHVSLSAHDMLYYRAKRIALALLALLPANESSYASELRQLTTDVKSLAGFDWTAFVQHMQAFRVKFDAEHR